MNPLTIAGWVIWHTGWILLGVAVWHITIGEERIQDAWAEGFDVGQKYSGH